MGDRPTFEVIPDHRPWEWIVVNTSGGKDSQAALGSVVGACDAVGIPREMIVMSHQCLGRMEWPGTLDLVKKHAEHYGLRLEVTSYQDKDKRSLTLLDYVRKRGMWPSNTNRFCTSEFKRGPGGRVITKLYRERKGPILNIYGFRAEESPARRKKKPLVINSRFSSAEREVWDWLPIHNWKEHEVWSEIRMSGIPYHPAYDKGMPRLSCRFCIFAPRSALIISGIENPDLLDEYCELEKEIQHDFQHGKPIREIKEAIQRGERPKASDGAWNM